MARSKNGRRDERQALKPFFSSIDVAPREDADDIELNVKIFFFSS